MPMEAVEVDNRRARVPERRDLEGRFVHIVPLDADAHSRALYDQLSGCEAEQLWRYMSDGPFVDHASFHQYLQRKQDSRDPLFFAIVDRASGVPIGYAAYLRIDPVHRSIEVGSILYTPPLQRTTGATEAMYLMARYIFEELGYRRYEWKCNAQNERSCRAALRLGFTCEGTFRQHMIVKGQNRDTAWFSMLDSEWPTRKASFLKWLTPANFDEFGRQILPLSPFNMRALAATTGRDPAPRRTQAPIVEV